MKIKCKKYVCLIIIIFIPFIITIPVKSQNNYNWYLQESEHFKIIYRDSHSHLVSHILQSAENALQTLSEILDYSPSEKIIINTNDFSDFGSAGTTTVPHNFIRLEIEPFELGYETMPFNDRLQWIISHELVHVAVNDQATKIETISRKLFSKVPPEKSQPITVFYSLLTNFSRYTPSWHQEGIAVFFETWLSGGYGRMLSNFDEMYFRTLVLENQLFPSLRRLDGKDSQTSYLLEMLFYLYGVRFVSYLASQYDSQKILDWFSVENGNFYSDFENKFKKTYGIDLNSAWNNFLLFEEEFQKENLERLKSAQITPIKKLQNSSFGWVTQPYYDHDNNRVFFGNHQSHKLTAINEINFATKQIKKIGSLPSPSMIQVSSTAYDQKNNLFFYTTNNNQLFRDVWVLSTNSMKKKLLFENVRVGQLTVSSETNELWGVQHSSGKATLVYSQYPYSSLNPITQFEVGDDLQQLAISPYGKSLAATLHRSSGQQAIIVADCEQLKNQYKFQYKIISEDGAPEHPSWSPKAEYLFWNSYTNGVSNIYRYSFTNEKIEVLSHTLSGLFRPIYINSDSLFAFEFTSDGFTPVLIPNRSAAHLPAIEYLGQKIVDKNPKVTNWVLEPNTFKKTDPKNRTKRKKYSSLSHIEFHSFIPIITGFIDQKVLGFYTHLADPLFIHDLTVEIGYSFFNEYSQDPKIHFRGKYEHERTFSIGIDHNATDFYDLFNERKRGMIGTKITLGNNYFWKYDNPHKIKQTSELAIYTGIVAINDNVVKVSHPDFFIFQTSVNSSNTRRSIGSIDKEAGSTWGATAMIFGIDPDNLELSGGVHLEWDSFATLKWPHNIFHLKLAAGYMQTKNELAISKYYFGGFGNRHLENIDNKQYRQVFRFPGIPIYSLAAKRFYKILIEHNLHPLRLAWPLIGHHYINYIDASWYSQGLLIDSENNQTGWIDLGTQINIVFKHWYNLESTFSAGIAKAWNLDSSNWEWFVSYRILR